MLQQEQRAFAAKRDKALAKQQEAFAAATGPWAKVSSAL